APRCRGGPRTSGPGGAGRPRSAATRTGRRRSGAHPCRRECPGPPRRWLAAGRDLRRSLDHLEVEPAARLPADVDGRAVADRRSDALPGQGRLDLLLDGALERPGPVDRVVAAVREIVTRRLAELEREVAIRQTECEPAELDVDDLPYVLAVERVKDDDVVDAVQKLRTEVLPERRQHLVADGLVRAACRGDGLAAEVGGHDDDGVLEVDRSTLAVGEPAVVEQLEQHVEHVVVCLLDLVEQQHAVRAPANGLGELATLLVADVSGRRA